MKKRDVLIIYTGGTIGMVHDYETDSLKAFQFENLLSQIPELNKFNLNLHTEALENPIDSSNMNPEVWSQLLDIIKSYYEKVDGFVILHGTDTMAYTASALSFMINNLSKPIILTGSQLPIDTIRTDGKENIITAIEIATTYYRAKARVPEVAILLDYSLHRGNRSTKRSTQHFNAFSSPNYPLLAEANVSIDYNKNVLNKTSEDPISFSHKMCGDIAVLKMFPGISQDMVKNVLSNPKSRAIILETYGAGNAITDKWFLDAIKKCITKGKSIINISQCKRGGVKQGLYQTSEKLKEYGVISAGDMTFEATITKLMHILGKYTATASIKREMEKNLRGERTVEELEFDCVDAVETIHESSLPHQNESSIRHQDE